MQIVSLVPAKRGYPHNIFLMSPQKYKLWVSVRSASEAPLMNTCNIRFYGKKNKKKKKNISVLFGLTHFILNRLTHTIYWKSPISILGMSGYIMYLFLEKKKSNYLQTVETQIRRRVLRRLILDCTVCQLPFSSIQNQVALICHLPEYNGLKETP